MKVTIDLFDRDWAKLAVLADKDGVKVVDLLTVAVTEKVAEMVNTRKRYRDCLPIADPATRIRIVELMCRNWPTTEIARELSLTLETVRSTLTDMGLPRSTKRLF